MAVNAWHEIPNTKIPLVSIGEAERLGIAGTTGPRSVIDAWNGAAFDGRRWFFHGGGHGDYGGNEFYVFDLRTLTFTLAKPPAPLTDMRLGYPTPTSGPQATHTYGGIIYTPKTGKIYIWGPYPYRLGGWGKVEGVYEVDPESFATRIATPNWFHGEQPATALLPNGDIFVHKNGSAAIFDPVGAQYRNINSERDFAEGVAAYVPTLGRIYVSNGRGMKYFDRSLRSVTHVATPMPPFNILNPGMAFHPPSKRLFFWDGSSSMWAFDPASEQWTEFPTAKGPSYGARAGVFGRFVYVPEADVFLGYNNVNEGVWVFKPEAAGTSTSAPFARGLSIKAMLEAAKDGMPGRPNVITLPQGVFAEAAVVRANNIIINANGTHLRGQAAEGKAALVIKGENVEINGLEVSGVKVGQNGAAIRWEGRNLTLRKVRFHGNEMNLLTNNKVEQGTLLIEDSLFGATDSQANLGHSLYAGTIGELIVRRSKFMGASNDGHLIKSRARRNTIENNLVWQGDTACSLAIDLSQGGVNTIRANIIQQGTRTDNSDIIGIGKETHDRWTKEHVTAGYIDTTRVGTPMHPEWPGSRTTIEGNLIISDWQNQAYVPGPHWSPLFVVSNGGAGPVTLRNNTIVWPGRPFSWQISTWHKIEASGNREFVGRAAAGLPPYPEVPRW